MKIVTADIIYDGKGNSFTQSAVVVDGKETIVDIIPLNLVSEKSVVESYEGFICPGFVNVHCHLELSHLHKKVNEAKGINVFLDELVAIREQDEALVQEAIRLADEQMFTNGIVLVGDICNTNHTIKIKQNSKLTYYNFIELFGLMPEKAEMAFERGNLLLDEFKKELPYQKSSLTPHAPYSVSDKLFGLINSSLSIKDIITIHNQESAGENEFFETLTGPVAERLKRWGLNLSHLSATQKSSIKSYFNKLKSGNPKLLIHNTFMDGSDLDFVKQTNECVYFGLCPNANWYIERKLPPVNLLKEYSDVVCIGTDSLASNYSLSIYDELLRLKQNFSELTWPELIKWGTYNGAKALGFSDVYGSISPGLRPGLINITPQNMVKRII